MNIELRQVEKFEALVDEFENRLNELKTEALEGQQHFFRAIEDLEEKFSTGGWWILSGGVVGWCWLHCVGACAENSCTETIVSCTTSRSHPEVMIPTIRSGTLVLMLNTPTDHLLHHPLLCRGACGGAGPD